MSSTGWGQVVVASFVVAGVLAVALPIVWIATGSDSWPTSLTLLAFCSSSLITTIVTDCERRSRADDRIRARREARR